MSKLFQWAILFVFVTLPALANTRAPNTVGEKSLLYWRYLCENSAQTETIQNDLIELSCPKQGWKVKAKVQNGVVSEIMTGDAI